MRIAYGVMGYGRGHAMRTSAVLPDLMREHEVRVFAGRDAYLALKDRFPCEGLPVIGYQYDASGRLSAPLKFRRNAGLTTDLLTHGPVTREVTRRLDSFAPDIVISDSETWTHRYARAAGIPGIGFDHVGIMAYCKCDFAPEDWLRGPRDALGYRAFMGNPERVLVSSFYPAEPRMSGVKLVGPILRDSVLAAQPTRGNYLLGYFNKGEHQFCNTLETVLRSCVERIIIYGTPQRGVSGNLDFRAPANEAFVRDLAGCKGLISTSGNQLLGEAVYLGKPVLTMPEDVVEQRLNARAVVNMGVGVQARLNRLSLSDLGQFLTNLDTYASNTHQHRRAGRAAALTELRRFLAELGQASRPAPKPLARLVGAY